MSAQRTVLVTGASSGIGHAIALAWAKRRANVILCGRERVALEEAAEDVARAGGKALAKVADVTREEDRRALIDSARSWTGHLDVLVNNAGRGYYGSVAKIDPAELEALFTLNVLAPLRLAQLAIDPLTRTGGTIVMMSSIAGVVAAPRMGAYAASKFALEAISQSLRSELAGTGIRVVVVRPGPVDTPFRENSVTTDGRAGIRPRSARVQTADEVADQSVLAVEQGRSVVETTGFVRLASATARFAPAALRWVTAAMAARLNR